MAYIPTENVKQVRQALKNEFPNIKFSVRQRHHSTLCVSIMESETDFSDIIGERQYKQINEYHLNSCGKHETLFSKIIDIMKYGSDQKWFDKSDAMTDYFHTAFYIDFSIGRWDKPYQLKKSASTK